VQTRIAFESCALDASRLQNTFCPIPTEILYACLLVIVNFLCKTVGTQSDIENVRNYTVCAKKNYSFLKVSEYYSNTWVTPNVRDIPNNEFFVQWCVIIVLRCVITSKLLFHISHKIFFQKTIVFFFAIRLMWW